MRCARERVPGHGWLDACVGRRACVSNPVRTSSRALQSQECRELSYEDNFWLGWGCVSLG